MSSCENLKYVGEICKRRFHSEIASNVFRPHNMSERLTTQQLAVNLDLCLRKTPRVKSRDFRDVIVSENVFVHTRPKLRGRFGLNSSGLKSVF